MKRALTFLMALAVAFTAAVAVPSTAEAQYKKRSLPNACAGATVEPFWNGKEYKFTPTSEGQDLFITAMAALDPLTGGESAVAEAKWASLCDPQRKAYLAWMKGVVTVGLYAVYDYHFSGSQLFGGTDYDGTKYDDPMDIEEIGALFQSEPRIFDIVAVGRPGTPHNGSTLDTFVSSVCRQTGTGCPKKAPATTGGSTASSSTTAATGGSTPSGSGSSGSPAATPACKDDKGQPKACPPPAATSSAPFAP